MSQEAFDAILEQLFAKSVPLSSTDRRWLECQVRQLNPAPNAATVLDLYQAASGHVDRESTQSYMLAFLATVCAHSARLDNPRAERPLLIMASTGEVARACRELGFNNLSVRYYRRALRISRKIGDRLGEALWLNNLGVAYRHLGSHRKAISSHKRAVSVARSVGDRDRLTDWMGNLMIAYEEAALDKYKRADYASASSHWKKALGISRDLRDVSQTAKLAANLGCCFQRIGKYSDSVKWFRRALAIETDQSRLIALLRPLAVVSGHLGDHLSARRYLHKGLRLARDYAKVAGQVFRTDDELQYAMLLGVAYLDLSQPQGALSKLNQLPGEVISPEQRQRAPSDAIRFFRYAQRVAHNRSEMTLWEQATLSLAILSEDTGDYAGVAESFASLLENSNIGPTTKKRWGLWDQLSRAQQRLGQHREGAASILKAAEEAVANGEESRVLDCVERVNVVVNQRFYGETEEAINCYRRGLALVRGVDPSTNPWQRAVLESQCLNNIGLLEYYLGRYGHALENLHESLRIAMRIAHPTSVVRSLDNLGMVQGVLGNIEEEITIRVEALGIARRLARINPRGLSFCLGNLAYALTRAQRANEAIPLANEAIDIAMEQGDEAVAAHWLRDLGDAYMATGEYGKANDCFRLGLDLARKVGDRIAGTLLEGHGDVAHALGDLDKAQEYYLQALPEVANGNPNSERVLQLKIGSIFHDQRNLVGAFEHYHRSIELMDGLRGSIHSRTHKESFVRDKAQVYTRMIQLLCNDLDDEGWNSITESSNGLPKSRYDAALHYVERAKCRVLVEMIASNLSTLASTASDRTRQELFLEAVRSTQDEAASDLKEAQGFLNKSDVGVGKGNKVPSQKTAHYLNELCRQEPELAQLVTVSALSVQAIRSDVLNDDEVLLEYFQLDEKTFVVFVADKEHGILRVERIPLIDPDTEREIDSLEAWIQRYCLPEHGGTKVWPFRSLSGFNKAFRLLIPPTIRNALNLEKDQANRRRKRLLVVAHGALHRIAFHALTADGQRFLVDEFQDGIVYAPSATALYHCKKKETCGVAENALILANPTGDLPFAEKQGQLLEQLYTNARAFYRNQAHAAALASHSESFDALVLLTHGIHVEKDNGDPTSSYFMLAGGTRVTVLSLYSLVAPASLHDYGFCFGATVTPQAGDEFISITRGGFCSGARSILAALWAVPDHEATVTLRIKFHEVWRETNNKALALKIAVNEVRSREEWRDPIFWAGFILVGDWQ